MQKERQSYSRAREKGRGYSLKGKNRHKKDLRIFSSPLNYALRIINYELFIKCFVNCNCASNSHLSLGLLPLAMNSPFFFCITFFLSHNCFLPKKWCFSWGRVFRRLYAALSIVEKKLKIYFFNIKKVMQKKVPHIFFILTGFPHLRA